MIALQQNKFAVGPLDVKINTSAKLWLDIAINIDKAPANVGALLQGAIDEKQITFKGSKTKATRLDIVTYKKEIYDLASFYLAGDHMMGKSKMRGLKNTNKQPKRIVDYEEDWPCICAAFKQMYNINLDYEIENMTWWEFLSYFRNLAPGCVWVDYYVYWRNYDLSSMPRKTEYEIKAYDAAQKSIESVSLLSHNKSNKKVWWIEKAKQLKKEM